MGAGVFHGRVRDGIGCIISAMTTGPPRRILVCDGQNGWDCEAGSAPLIGGVCAVWLSAMLRGLVLRAVCWLTLAGVPGRCGGVDLELYRAIRTAQLRQLPVLHLRPIDVVVYHGPRRDLVLRLVSRLDAFSGYPFRTWPPGHATGVTTGSPEVRPSRSSRTRDGSSQVSYTHGR